MLKLKLNCIVILVKITMENSNKIIPPHLNAEVYRTDTTGTSTLLNLDYIRIHSDGTTLVGCSELTGRYWKGGANVLKTITDVSTRQVLEKKSIDLTNGTADGCFVDSSDKILLCEDSGTVSMWSKGSDNRECAWREWLEEASVAEHDNAALAIDCLHTGKEYVTVGADGNAKVWDINEMICVRNYIAAHSLAIYAVSVKPDSKTTFATGSLDQYVTLWDNKIDKPVQDIAKNNCGVRAVRWLNENQLIFGDEAGVLYNVDVRNASNVVTLLDFPAAIHKIEIQPGHKKVAVCCDNKIVTVCDISDNNKSATIVYHDRHMHTNYVRGIAWGVEDSDTLYTVGWDGEVKSHKLI